MRSKFLRGKKLSIVSKSEIKARMDNFLSQQYQHFIDNNSLKPSSNNLYNCGSDNNNQMIMEYIRTVYKEYKIPDPLQKQAPYSSRPSPPYQPSSFETPVKKPIYSHTKNHTMDSMPTEHKRGYSATPRNIKIEYGRNSQMRQSSIQKESYLGRESEEVRNPFRGEERSIFRFSRRINSQTFQEPVKESFRYCIGCEQAVLTSNIAHHETTCIKYQKFYSMNLEQIMDALHQKIENLRKKTRESTEKNLLQGDRRAFSSLNTSICQQSEKIYKIGELSNKFVNDYNSAMEIGRRWGTVSEDVNKLRWFMRMREMIRKKFGC